MLLRRESPKGTAEERLLRSVARAGTLAERLLRARGGLLNSPPQKFPGTAVLDERLLFTAACLLPAILGPLVDELRFPYIPPHSCSRAPCGRPGDLPRWLAASSELLLLDPVCRLPLFLGAFTDELRPPLAVGLHCAKALRLGGGPPVLRRSGLLGGTDILGGRAPVLFPDCLLRGTELLGGSLPGLRPDCLPRGTELLVPGPPVLRLGRLPRGTELFLGILKRKCREDRLGNPSFEVSRENNKIGLAL